MKILITGVAGFIGMHTAIKYLENGYDVIGIDNLNNYYDYSLKKDRIKEIKKVEKKSNTKFHFFKLDLRKKDFDKKILFKEINIVIHLAAQPGVRYSIENPNAYFENNILAFQNILNYIKINKIKKFIYASSSSVYGKNSIQPFEERESCTAPESYYAATKRINELMAFAYFKTYNLPSIGLRFFTVYGPWGRPDMAPYIFTKNALEEKEVKIYNHGLQKRDFTYIDDIVNSIFKLSEKELFFNNADIINVGNGNPCNLMDFIKQIEKIIDKPLKKKFEKSQLGDVEETFADINKLRNKINFKPKINLETGLDKFIRWYKLYNKLK